MNVTNNTIQIEMGHRTDVGLVREHNEDALLVHELDLEGPHFEHQLAICAVADGMGGHQAGEVASNLALETLADHLSEAVGAAAAPEPDAYAVALTKAVEHANTVVFSRNTSTHGDMGTTLVTALLVNETVFICNVGDSRAYLMHDGLLRQVTTDHSLVAELVAAGRIAPEDIYTHPRRNIVTRSLGTESRVLVDSFSLEVRPGSVLLLCSDGLWEMVRDNQLRDVLLQSSDAQEACDALVKLANENGGADNIAVIVARITEKLR